QTSSPWKNTFLARTGYTGELGFEILLPNEVLRDAYAVLMDAGKEFGIKPVGFGARDTLRLEVAMLLYGHDMTDETTPLEAGLERTVAFEKEFIGKEALRAQQQRGVSRKLIGFEMVGHGLARQGYPVYQKEHSVGIVTSGSFSPSFKKNIGLAYVSGTELNLGDSVDIQIRSNQIAAKIVAIPFYKRQSRS
ncbi:MAG: glycine cleavage system aminomethyltransferase GcvT, partial [Candidatus Omnitrophica bacterium]|nr:glycine cleavage system aminomethyltransferase GcvT [Candidatus Omnitrophota bacterium]